MCVFFLGGCAHQVEPNLLRGEVFVSEHKNKQHKIRLNPKKIYTFKIKFGHTSKSISPQEDTDL